MGRDLTIEVRRLPELHAPAPPWKHNPSSWRQRVPICVLAMVGFVIAAYMALFQWGFVDHVWDPVFGEQTDRVLDSDLSHAMHRWMRIPDASLGALAYLGDAIFGLIGSTRRWQFRPWAVILFGIDVIPLGVVSALLVVAQGTIVGSWCFLCLVTAAVSLILVLLAFDEVWSTIRYLHRVWKAEPDRRLFWRTFWGEPTATAFRVGREMVTERERR